MMVGGKLKYSMIIGWMFVAVMAYGQSRSFSFELFEDKVYANQSAACYGKYLFLISDKLSQVTLYDLEEKRIICKSKQTERNLLNGKTVVYHCNQSCFGKERYRKKDIFPLLYISQRAKSNKTGGFISVMRVLPVWNEWSQITSVKLEEVQNIIFPAMDDWNCLGNPNAVVDTKRGYMYVYSRNLNSKAKNFNKGRVTKFKLPKFCKRGKIQTEVCLTMDDVKDSFDTGCSLNSAQAGIYLNGKIYLTMGYPTKIKHLNFIKFREIDLRKRKCTHTVDMMANGFRWEPEGMWLYDNQIMVSTNGKRIFTLQIN